MKRIIHVWIREVVTQLVLLEHTVYTTPNVAFQMVKHLVSVQIQKSHAKVVHIVRQDVLQIDTKYVKEIDVTVSYRKLNVAHHLLLHRLRPRLRQLNCLGGIG